MFNMRMQIIDRLATTHGFALVLATLVTLSGCAASYQITKTPGSLEHTVRAVFVSTDTRATAWSNEVRLTVGDENVPSDENVLLAPSKAAMRRGINELLSSLPDYSGSSR